MKLSFVWRRRLLPRRRGKPETRHEQRARGEKTLKLLSEHFSIILKAGAEFLRIDFITFYISRPDVHIINAGSEEEVEVERKYDKQDT